MSKFFICVIAVASSVFLTACGQSQEVIDAQRVAEEARAKAQTAEVYAAGVKTELRIIKESAAKKERLAAATKEVNVIARVVVRDSQLTDKAGCRIVPVTLTDSPSYKEFGAMMSSQYRGQCAREVVAYVNEREAAAAKAIAAANAASKKRQPVAPVQLAKAEPRKK